jgi:hypothetical protein
VITAFTRVGSPLSVIVLGLLMLGACAQEQHPLDRQLSQLRPDAVVLLAGLDWPAGTLLCPMTPYQSTLSAEGPVAKRVNGYLKRTQFTGDEHHWSLVVVKPAQAGDDGIEHLRFKRGTYDVVTDERRVAEAVKAQSRTFTQQACVPVEQARVLVTRDRSQRNLVSFGTS